MNFETNCEVIEIENIIIISTQFVTNNGVYQADLVVSNADPSYFYQRFLKRTPKKIFNKPIHVETFYGIICFIFLNKKTIYDDVKHHTIIFNKRHKDLLDDIFDKKVYITDPSLYLHRPAATDKKNIQNNSDSFYVLAPVANNESAINWERKRE
jgi:phytoene desaturase